MSGLSISQKSNLKISNVVWILVALGAQTGWGANPVLSRYLQTVSHLPSMSILGFGHLVVLLIISILLLPHMDLRVFRQPILWLFGMIVFIRATTNLLSSRFTLAIYVQLINLLTPFLVVFLAKTLLGEKLPRYTWQAILVSLFGALLMTSADMSGNGMKIVLEKNDWLGIGLAFISTFFLALYMIITRFTIKYKVTSESVLYAHIFTLCVASTVISFLIREDWASWGKIRPVDWLVFIIYTLGVVFVSNLGQILSIRHLSASLVSSLLPWRLVSALLFAPLLIGERLSSFLQLFGVLIIVVTISWYLWQQGDQSIPIEAD